MKQKFCVGGMTCAACSSHVEKAVEKVEGVQSVNVNLLLNNMIVEYDEGKTDITMIENAVFEAGYSASLPDEAGESFPGGATNATTEKTKNSSKSGKRGQKLNASGDEVTLTKIIVGAVLLLVTMYFSMGNMMWGWPAPELFDHHLNPVGFALIQLALCLPVLWIFRRYFTNGFKRLFKKSPNMDSLIAVGAAASFLYSVISLFIMVYAEGRLAQIALGAMDSSLAEGYHEMLMTYHDSLYFEAAEMILVLVSVGKYLEGLSKKKTTKAIEKLIDLSPKKAVVLVDGVEKEIPAQEVKKNDIVIVKKGDLVPVDGVILSGSGSLDESNLTGESLPVYKKEGEEVFASTLLTAGYLQIRAEKVGEDTSLANVIRLVEEAANSKAPISRLADKISAVFVPVIFTIALLTFIINLLVQKFAVGAANAEAFELAFRFAITVVVIACPCALGLATPVAIMVGTGKGAENGLLIRDAETLEKAHALKTIILDKTGTITEGKPRVTDFIGETDILMVLYGLENLSEHPLAQAICEYASEKNASPSAVQDFLAVDGVGLFGTVNSVRYGVGNSKLLSEEISLSRWSASRALTKEQREENERKAEEFIQKSAREGKTPLIICKEGEVVGFVAVKDEVRPSSKAAVAALKKEGLKVVMLTGDNRLTAEAIGREVGVDEVISEVFPAEKREVVAKYQTGKNLVAMVGDGVNDAPALMQADVGIAMGGGSDIAVESGDIVLLKKDLMDVKNAISLSKRTITTIKIGLFWAFFYNFLCVLVSTGIFFYPFGLGMRPEYGSIAMSISSVSVVLNALTINFFRPEGKKAKAKKKGVLSSASQSEVAGEVTLKVKGMMCEHCEKRVADACLKVSGVTGASASHKKKRVTLKTNGEVDLSEVKKNIRQAGYEVIK